MQNTLRDGNTHPCSSSSSASGLFSPFFLVILNFPITTPSPARHRTLKLNYRHWPRRITVLEKKYSEKNNLRADTRITSTPQQRNGRVQTPITGFSC